MFEAIPAAVSEVVCERIEVPVIGIGAGPATDGQVLVFHDLLGIYDGHAPRFAKRYGELKALMVAGVAEYADEVRSGAFPAPSTSTRSTSEELAEFSGGSGPRDPRSAAAGHRRRHVRKAAAPWRAARHYHGWMPRLAQVFAPRDRVYFDLFEEAGRNIFTAADLLDRLLADYPDNAQLARDILDCEHEGDRITHDIIDRLNHTFVTPIDREDILALASALDDVVDYTEEVADYLGLYKIEAPMDQAIKLAQVLKAACRQISEAIPRLRGLQRTSPSTRSRSTGSRTRATGSPARRWPRCSTAASTRWS